jgi:isoleucyl-tRNA synthetase
MGTGIVHTAPAHGLEDFHASNKYNLEIVNHVGSDGRFLETAFDFSGMNLEEANKKSIEMLGVQSNLLSKDSYQHSFPHCWRHKTPLFFRATPQWFISMTAENLLENSMNSIDSVNWMPDWGKSRITSMMEERPDWCISRQRTWGVPIALYLNKKTGELHPDTVSIMQKVADEIEKSGTDVWFEQKLESVNVGDEYEPVMDILDVWFDSGVTHYCVLNEQRGLSQPADLYLEGSDQHRGWFQSSLLTGMTINSLPPFRNVVTHGFVVDSEGKKMSKSLGNVVSPQSIWNQKGADILRAWVASTEFRNEMNFSNEILDRTTDSYRKIRNTIRFLLSNLYDFDETNQLQKINELVELDQFIVAKAMDLQRDIVADYENFDFHLAFQKILNFCTNELGSFYLDIIKDRAYTCHHDGPARKSSQTAMFHLLQMLIRWISPIISFTAEEAWKEFSSDESSIFEKEWYSLLEPLESDLDLWDDLINLKDEVNKNIEILREEGSIGSSLDAEVHITFSENDFLKFSRFGEELKFLFLVSNVSLSVSDQDLDEPKIDIKVSIDEKCERCWHHVADLSDHEGNKICSRCISNLSFPGEERQMI